jgi:hypothetical protein
VYHPALIAVAAVAASAAATTVIALLGLALGAASDFMPLQPAAYLTFATVGTLAGIGGWMLVVRLVKQSARLLRTLVPTLVILTLVPDVVLLVSPFIPGATPVGVIALMLMHPIVATVAVLAGRRIAPAQ